jgi:hypothetical protein
MVDQAEVLRLAAKLQESMPVSLRVPVVAYLGQHDANDPIFTSSDQSKVYVRVGNYQTPEVERALLSPAMRALYHEYIRHNMRVMLTRTKRGDLKVVEFDVYAEIENFSGRYPQPLIVVDVTQATGVLGVGNGGTGADLSATGAATHFVRQASSGAAFTVGAITANDLPTVPVNKGGTNRTTLTANNLLVGAGTSAVNFLAPGSNGNIAHVAGGVFVSAALNLATALFSNQLPLISGGTNADLSSAEDGDVIKSGSALATIKHNLSASAAPTVDDDSGDGYAIGSRWLDTTNDKAYICFDASSGAAVWVEITAGNSTAPTITDFTDAQHNHQNAAGGGQLNASSVFNTGTVPVARLPVLVGATGSVNGTEGLVPQPLIGDRFRFLRGTGNWVDAVAQVVFSAPSDVFSVSNSFSNGITTIILSKVSTDVGRFYASPPASSGNPTFRAIQNVDIATALASPPSIGGTSPAVITGTTITANTKIVTGNGSAGAKTIEFVNANTGVLSWNPTGSRTLTLPDATDTLVGRDTTDTLTNKTLTAPAINYITMAAGSNRGNSRWMQDSTDKRAAFQTAEELYHLLSGAIWKLLNNTTAITATSETSITSGTTWGSLAIPANATTTGSSFEFDFYGESNASAGRIRFVMRVNGTSAFDVRTQNITNSTSSPFAVRVLCHVVNTSGSNNMRIGVEFNGQGGTVFLDVPALFSWDVTIANTFTFFMYWANSPSSQSLTVSSGVARVL